MSEQLNLWDRPSLNPVPRVKEAMRQALKGCPLSREQVVDRMNGLARADGLATNGKAKAATADMLDKWVADSGEHLIPWKLLPIFCHVVGDLSPLRALVAPLGADIIDVNEKKLLKLARADREIKKLRRLKQQIETEIDL